MEELVVEFCAGFRLILPLILFSLVIFEQHGE